MEISYDSFEHVHATSLTQSGVPKRFWRKIFEKIVSQSFDAGEAFGLAENASQGLVILYLSPKFTRNTLNFT